MNSIVEGDIVEWTECDPEIGPYPEAGVVQEVLVARDGTRYFVCLESVTNKRKIFERRDIQKEESPYCTCARSFHERGCPWFDYDRDELAYRLAMQQPKS